MSLFSRRHTPDIDIKDLIQQYKRYECLWNFNSPDYKCKSLKLEAWQEIADNFNKDINEVKRKIKYLRSAYVAEKRKIYLSKKSGTETPHKPSLFYFEELDFLDDIVVLRKGGNGPDNDLEFDNSTFSQDTEDNDDLSFENREDIDFKQCGITCKVESLGESQLELSSLPKISNSPKLLTSRALPSQPVKRRISGEIKLDKIMPTNVSFRGPDRKSQCKNLYISFGKTIALQLQQMSLEVAILAMSEVHAIITKKSLEHIKSLRKHQESPSEDSLNEIIEEDFIDSS